MSSTATCSASSCTNVGILVCSGCVTPASHYCSNECQKRDWGIHKACCASTQKSNCYIVRATSSSSFAACVESFPLNDYGSEMREIAELKRRLGWKVVDNVGKFYDRKGSDTWYYYVYGPRPSTLANASAKNNIASICCGLTVYGDVAVIRSAPVDTMNNYPMQFTKAVLTKDLEFYRTEDTYVVFQEREKSRVSKRMGVDLTGVPFISRVMSSDEDRKARDEYRRARDEDMMARLLRAAQLCNMFPGPESSNKWPSGPGEGK